MLYSALLPLVASLVTLMVLFTKYAVPTSLLCTVALAVLAYVPVVSVAVGAVVSRTYALEREVPSAKEEFTTLAIKVLLPESVAPLSEKVVLPVVAVAAVQVLPLSVETFTVCPDSNDVDKVPLTVWLAVLVMRSLALEPVSSPMTSVDTEGMVVLELLSDELLVTLTFTVVSDFFLAPDKPKSPKAPMELLLPPVNHAKNPPEPSSSSSSDFFLPFFATFSVLSL
jgi:hypothetical protein